MASKHLRRLHLVRHAEYIGYSRSTAQFIGRTDPPLSSAGQDQAKAFGAANPDLSGIPVFSSPAQRARQTAELALPAATAQITPSALEGDFGALEGLTAAAALRLFPEHFAGASAASRFDYRAFGGECLADLVCRADALLHELRDHHEALVFSHGIFLSILAQRVVGQANAMVPPFDLCMRLSLHQARVGTWTIQP